MPTNATKLDWYELIELHVVRKVAELVGRRWNLGFGYIDVARSQVYPPVRVRKAVGRGPCQLLQDSPSGRKACTAHGHNMLAALEEAFKASGKARIVSLGCHAGLTEFAAPVVVDGVLQGALLCGGYLPEEQDQGGLEVVSDYVPRLSRREVSFVEDLLEEAAAEIAAFLLGVGKIGGVGPEGKLRTSYQSIVGSSAPMQALYSLLDRVATSDSTVLVTGENGTGKELVAKAIHAESHRRDKPFVVQNCSAFNDNLLDSELFGHKRGAFTGAVTDKKGLFEIAHKGTFFLDEIGDMSSSLQVKVLRVLQEGTFTPVGGTETKHCDVRIVAATNRDLKTMVEEGTFREDLYYRLSVIHTMVPSLGERPTDIPILAHHFLLRLRSQVARQIDGFTRDAMHAMSTYAWPGNVRELRNVVDRALALSPQATSFSDLRIAGSHEREDGGLAIRSDLPYSEAKDAILHSFERKYLADAFARNASNIAQTARDIGLDRKHLATLLKKHGLR